MAKKIEPNEASQHVDTVTEALIATSFLEFATHHLNLQAPFSEAVEAWRTERESPNSVEPPLNPGIILSVVIAGFAMTAEGWIDELPNEHFADVLESNGLPRLQVRWGGKRKIAFREFIKKLRNGLIHGRFTFDYGKVTAGAVDRLWVSTLVVEDKGDFSATLQLQEATRLLELLHGIAHRLAIPRNEPAEPR